MRQKLKTNFLENSLPMPHCPGISPLLLRADGAREIGVRGGCHNTYFLPGTEEKGAEGTELGTKRLFRSLIQADGSLSSLSGIYSHRYGKENKSPKPGILL